MDINNCVDNLSFEDTSKEVIKFNIDEYNKIIEIAEPFWERGISENPPKFIVFMGGVGSGKTTIRKQEYATGYVHFECGEILNAIDKELERGDPRLSSYATLASNLILNESLTKKKNIVIEIIGDNYSLIEPVLEKMKELGYETFLKFINCDPVEAYKRHMSAVKEDPEYNSVYFTQEATFKFLYHQLGLGEVPKID